MYADETGALVDAASSGEVLIALVVNKPISVVNSTLLEFLARFLARQGLMSSLRSGKQSISNIDVLAQEADEYASRQLQDDLRTMQWEEAARRLSDRARNDGLSLEVRYGEPLLEKAEIDRRAPLNRRVYNSLVPVRAAIDRVASAFGSLRLSGNEVPPDIFREIQATLDIGSMHKYSAHLMRDAFVCGNGYLAFELSGRASMRLLQPELVHHVGEDKYEVRERSSDEFRPAEGRILHIPGARQVGSDYGISLLEPFLQIAAQNESMNSIVQESALLQPPPNYVEDATEWLSGVIGLRERTLADNAQRVADTLGRATAHLSDSSAQGLYFPGLELMPNAIPELRFSGSRPHGHQ